MKRLISIALVAFLPGHFVSSQETSDDSANYEYNLTGEGVELSFKVMKEPMFPVTLKSKGTDKGEVTVLLEIDYQGELRDWLVTHASHKDFARAVDNAVSAWKFEPPLWNGKPISVISAINIDFRATGNVMSLDMTSSIAEIYTSIGATSFDAIKVAEFDDLDRFPEPVKVVTPQVPKKLLKKRGYHVGVFRFFIDTEGHVRLAHIDRVEGTVDVRALEAAQDALEQWEFTPPTVKGRPVVVEVAQPFRFEPNG